MILVNVWKKFKNKYVKKILCKIISNLIGTVEKKCGKKSCIPEGLTVIS